MSDYYKALGLEKNASEADIKGAYRKLVQKYHPDKNQGNKDSEKKFKEVQEAYEVLSDKQKRSQYDQFGQAGASAGGMGFDPSHFNDFGGFADIFESFFGGGMGREQRAGKQNTQGSDIETELEISFEEAVFGTTKHLELTKPETCDSCKGTGAEPGKKVIDCSECGGKGQVRSTRQTILGQISSVHVCPQCQGRGKIPEEVCKTCQGQTRVRKNSQVSVSIPRGVDNGTRVRMKGKGSAGVLGGEYGDLYLYIRVAAHPKFSREGSTIYSSESIPMLQAILGAEVKVDTVHGKADLSIPAGTQSGTEFTVKGKGAPSLKNDQFGDHKITIHVETPRKLTKAERKAYEELAKEKGIAVNAGSFNLF